MNTMDNMRRISVAIVMVIVMQSVFCSCNSDEQNTTFTQDFSPIKIEETEAQVEESQGYESAITQETIEFNIQDDGTIEGESDRIRFDAIVNDYDCTEASIYEIQRYDRETNTHHVFSDIGGYEYGALRENNEYPYSADDSKAYVESIMESFEYTDVDVSEFNNRVDKEYLDVVFSSNAVSYHYAEGWDDRRFSISDNPDLTLPAEFDLITIRPNIDGIPLHSSTVNSSSYSNVTYNSLDEPITGWIMGASESVCIMDDSTLLMFNIYDGEIIQVVKEKQPIVPIYSCLDNAVLGISMLMENISDNSATVYAAELEYNIITDRHNFDFEPSDKYYFVPTWRLYCYLDGLNEGFYSIYLDAFTGELLYTNV